MRRQLGFGRAEIALIILLVCGGGLVLWSYFKSDRSPVTSPSTIKFNPDPGQYGDEAIQAIRSDLQVLQEGSAAPEVLAESLVRLSYAAQDQVRPWAMKYQTHPSPAVQMAVVEALGGFPDSEALDVIVKALQRDNRDLRLKSLQSLGRLQSAYRAYQINEFLKQAKDPEEIQMALLSLYKCSNQSNDRQQAAIRLVQSIGKDPDPTSQDILIDLLPRLERLDEAVDLSWAWLKSTDSTELALRSFLYLKDHDSRGLKENFASIPIHQSSAYRQTLIDYAKRTCSSSAVEIEGALKNRENKSSIQINCR